MNIAVITGASSGMGREFARAFAAMEPLDELWVIARRRGKLEELSADIENRSAVAVRVLELDLLKEESFKEYSELLRKLHPNVRTLVNAAGFGLFKQTESSPLETLENMIELNDKALVRMTHITLPYMGGGSKIINMGSLSAFQPVPYINTYAASKAFVLSFSRALNVELRHRGVRVMAVCPGWVLTEFFTHAMTDDAVTYFNRFYTPKQVVSAAIKDYVRGKDVSVCGLPTRLQVAAVKLLPHTLVMDVWMRQQQHK